METSFTNPQPSPSHRLQPQSCGRATLQVGTASFSIILEALSKVRLPPCHCNLPSVKPMVACGCPQGCIPWLCISWPCLLAQLPNTCFPRSGFPLWIMHGNSYFRSKEKVGNASDRMAWAHWSDVEEETWEAESAVTRQSEDRE